MVAGCASSVKAEERTVGQRLHTCAESVSAVSYTHLDVYKRQNLWTAYRSDLVEMKPIHLPRCFGDININIIVDLHGFCDASS